MKITTIPRFTLCGVAGAYWGTINGEEERVKIPLGARGSACKGDGFVFLNDNGAG